MSNNNFFITMKNQTTQSLTDSIGITVFPNGSFYQATTKQDETYLDIFDNEGNILASNVRGKSAVIFDNGNYVINTKNDDYEFWASCEAAPTVILKDFSGEFMPDGRYYDSTTKKLFCRDGTLLMRDVNKVLILGYHYIVIKDDNFVTIFNQNGEILASEVTFIKKTSQIIYYKEFDGHIFIICKDCIEKLR